MRSIMNGLKLLIVMAFLLVKTACATEEGLVAYWAMDEGNGDIVRDLSGNGNDGVVHNAKWVDGYVGKALEFDGKSSYVFCGNGESLNVKNAITIDAWVKIYSYGGGGIVSKYSGSAGGYYLTACWRDDSRPFFYVRKDSSIYRCALGPKLELGVWHHLIATAQKGDSKLRLCIDGKGVNTGGIWLDWSFANDIDDLVLGRYGGDFFHGVIDEIKIYNRVLSDEEISNNFKLLRKKVAPAKIAVWRNGVSVLERRLNKERSRTNLSAAENYLIRQLEAEISFLDKEIERLAVISYIASAAREVTEATAKVDLLLTQAGKNLNALSKVKNKAVLSYIVSPVTSLKILPHDAFISGEIASKIQLKACPGEYEPGSFVLSAFTDMSSLQIKVTNLQCPGGVIPSGNVDVKVVKCWYQGGTAWTSIGSNPNKVLVPELLLNDDTLVKVDYDKKDNYVKLNFPAGEKYICISNLQEKSGEMKILSSEEFPVKDSSSLLPVRLDANISKQFWITVKIPEKAKPGMYNGKILIKSPVGVIDEIKLEVMVLPFKLAPAYTSSLFYRGRFDTTDNGSISSELKSRVQYKKELENMLAHGVTNPIMYQLIYQPFDEKLLDEALRLRDAAGMGRQPLYYCGLRWGYPSVDLVKRTIDIAGRHGISEVYFFGLDEASRDLLSKQRSSWEAIRQAGGKIFASGSDNFGLMGDIQDLFIRAGLPSSAEAAKWQAAGHKIWAYGCPQGGVENPEIYRRNYGFKLLLAGYDGAATYAYQHSFGNIWNDFDHHEYRDHNFTYPTMDGVIDTIAWEGYREGVDDARYLATLIKAIATARKSGPDRIRRVADRAQKYLETLDASLDNKRPETIRAEIINYILKLKN